MADKIEVLISKEAVDKRISELAEQISKDYEGKEVHMIGVLKGAAFFMSALAQKLTVPVSLDYMCVSSYGSSTKSSGIVKIVKDLDEPLMGKDVLIAEDIIDSGRTLNYLKELFRDRGAASLRICTLLNKPERRVVEMDVDYIGFDIPDKFVVGWGMDYDQLYRNLPYIGVVTPDAKAYFRDSLRPCRGRGHAGGSRISADKSEVKQFEQRNNRK